MALFSSESKFLNILRVCVRSTTTYVNERNVESVVNTCLLRMSLEMNFRFIFPRGVILHHNQYKGVSY